MANRFPHTCHSPRAGPQLLCAPRAPRLGPYLQESRTCLLLPRAPAAWRPGGRRSCGRARGHPRLLELPSESRRAQGSHHRPAGGRPRGRWAGPLPASLLRPLCPLFSLGSPWPWPCALPLSLSPRPSSLSSCLLSPPTNSGAAPVSPRSGGPGVGLEEISSRRRRTQLSLLVFTASRGSASPTCSVPAAPAAARGPFCPVLAGCPPSRAPRTRTSLGCSVRVRDKPVCVAELCGRAPGAHCGYWAGPVFAPGVPPPLAKALPRAQGWRVPAPWKASPARQPGREAAPTARGKGRCRA